MHLSKNLFLRVLFFRFYNYMFLKNKKLIL